MEFISSEDKPISEPISWPNMCVWCSGVPTKTYKVKVGGFLRTPWRKSRKEFECPICGQHYFWLKGLEISLSVLFAVWVLSGLIWVPFSASAYFPLLFLLLLVLVLIRYLIEPVRISEERGLHSIMIRNEGCAREFARLNNLSPV
jgi:hypothetical protein